MRHSSIIINFIFNFYIKLVCKSIIFIFLIYFGY